MFTVIFSQFCYDKYLINILAVMFKQQAGDMSTVLEIEANYFHTLWWNYAIWLRVMYNSWPLCFL